jgi:hypothetical protein
MDKQLHIYILDVLQQNNAIANMVDIKPAFLDELDTQEKRKNFKAQLDFLSSENLIETNGKFEFLGWELLTGLYPIDSKKIEVRLAGQWQSYLASKRGTYKREAATIPTPLPAPPVKQGLYDTPASVLAYPGVNRDAAPAQPEPAAPAQKTSISATVRRDDDDGDFMPFKTKAQQKPAINANADMYLKEEDFLPFKSRNTATAKPAEPLPNAEPQQKPVTDDSEPLFTSSFSVKRKDNTPPKPEEPGPIGREPIFTADTHYTPPKPEDVKPGEPQAFSNLRTSYTPPKTGTPDVAINIKPFTPEPKPAPQDKPAGQPPARIAATVKRKDQHYDEAPIITARTAGLRAKQQPAAPEPEPPAKEAPAPPRVVNLSSSAPAPISRPAEPLHRVPVPAPSTPVSHIARTPIVPPGHSSIHFDTENNPFNSLGTITLSNNDEKNNTINWATIIKWAVIGIIAIVVIAVVVMYKKRYS